MNHQNPGPGPIRRGLSVREFASRLGVSDNKVHQMISGGEVRSIKLGDRRVVPDTEVDRLLDLARFSEPIEAPSAPRGRGRPRTKAVAEK